MTTIEFYKLLATKKHYLLDTTIMLVTDNEFSIDKVFQDVMKPNIYHMFQYIPLQRKLVYSIYNVFLDTNL